MGVTCYDQIRKKREEEIQKEKELLERKKEKRIM